jgi:hypothetical protein
MSRQALTLAGFFAAGCLAVVGYSLVTRVEPAAEQAPRPLVTASMASPSPSPSSQFSSPPPEALPSPPEPAPAAPPAAMSNVDRLVAEATSENAKARTYAISALAKAPKDAALPVLTKVLNRGDLEEERHLALESLQTLALDQGDEDGRVKDVLRQFISHSGDEQFAEVAQRTMDTIP